MSDEKVSFAPFGANSGNQPQASAQRPAQAGASNISRGFGMGGASTSRTQSPKTEKAFNPSGIFDLIISVSFMAIFFGIPVFFTGMTFQGIAFET